MDKKLRRNIDNKVFAGVCSGIAEFYDLDVKLVRGAFVVGLLFGSLTFWIYLIMAVIVPEKDKIEY